jgi:DeoR/GlpR family transcriptional regulator of sugar metabolism
MIVRERRNRIVTALRTAGAASVSELAASLRVSESTIRRDLDLLDRDGELRRTYGGAVVLPREVVSEEVGVRRFEGDFAADRAADHETKQSMAVQAARLVTDGDIVILDIGTTTPLIARALKGRPVTVVTSNLAVLDELREDPAVRVILLGGVLRRNYQTLVGSLVQLALKEIDADILFLSCTGLRPSGHVVDDMAVEAPIKQLMIDASDRIVLLASAKKFPGTGPLRLCSVRSVDVVITTTGANEETLNLCREAGGEVIYA